MAWTPFTRADHDRSALRYTSDMTDAEFALIAPLFPDQPRRGRKRRTDLRAVVNAIFYTLQNGCAWANLPKDFPPPSTVYGYFRQFTERGIWAHIHAALYADSRELDGREPQPSAAIIDSQSVKTGPSARGNVGFDAGKKVKGRKRHILVDTLGLLLRCDVHGADLQDRDGAVRLFDRLTARFPFLEVFFGDAAYAGDKMAQAAPRPVEIVRRCDTATGFQVLRKRWIVERTLAWITANRRMARDFERYALTANAFIQIAMIKLMTRRLARFVNS
ncbi:MAG: IS5 family transposase [Pseudomonadota bacterium]